jgi:uncharacterized surface protein with fasciclin (FAS1) repeats
MNKKHKSNKEGDTKMKKMSLIQKSVMVLGITLGSASVIWAGNSCGGSWDKSESATAKKVAYEHSHNKANIVEVAKSAGSFNTLLAAAKAAGLAETLMGEGPFTVFAPTDEAFAKLPAGTVESLLKPENKEKLASILKYHVVPGKVEASQVVGMTSAPTALGENLRIKVQDGQVMINDANVIQTDIPASNGVIHVIDAVVLP